MFGISATAVAGLVGAGTGLYSAYENSQNTPAKAPSASVGSGGAQTVTQQAALDPRMQAILYGDGTAANPGMLSHITSLNGQPQNAGMSAFGNGAANYLGANGAASMGGMQSAADGLMGSHISAPTMGTPSPMGAAQVQSTPGMQAAHVQATPGMPAAMSNAAQINAPSQNGINLAPAYNNMVNGNAGANPYLTRALQSGVDQTNASYEQNQKSLTDNLTRNVLPGIGDGAQAAGGYGGTRQGIAEGNAIGDYTKQMTNANLQLGLANSANTTGAQAGAYNQGQDRSLSAMTSLGGQQYGVATNNAAMEQATNLSNAANQQGAYAQNYQGNLAGNLANAGYNQQAGSTNYTGLLNSNMANSGYQQGANSANYAGNLTTGQANLGSQQSTNQLNSANSVAGIGANSGLMNSLYGYGTNQQNYDLNHTGAISNMIQPFTGLGGSSATTNPLYSNTAGNVIGGATAGLGLMNAYNSATGGGYKYNDGSNFNQSGNAAYDGNQLFNPSLYAQ